MRNPLNILDMVDKPVPRKAGAAFHVGTSSDEYATPPEFIDAVKAKFGIEAFAYDLAASAENTKAEHFFSEEENSLEQDWRLILDDLWLNPPYARIAPWAEKCAERADIECRIFLLVPAAVGSNWWRDFVHDRARVYLLNGRISFDGKAPYPKDCALCVYGEPPGYEIWSWRGRR